MPASHDPPVGVQLVVAGSADDALFAPFRDALIADPALLAQYNALKLSLDGADYERYTDAKGAFVERVLARGAAALGQQARQQLVADDRVDGGARERRERGGGALRVVRRAARRARCAARRRGRRRRSTTSRGSSARASGSAAYGPGRRGRHEHGSRRRAPRAGRCRSPRAAAR